MLVNVFSIQFSFKIYHIYKLFLNFYIHQASVICLLYTIICPLNGTPTQIKMKRNTSMLYNFDLIHHIIIIMFYMQTKCIWPMANNIAHTKLLRLFSKTFPFNKLIALSPALHKLIVFIKGNRWWCWCFFITNILLLQPPPFSLNVFNKLPWVSNYCNWGYPRNGTSIQLFIKTSNVIRMCIWNLMISNSFFRKMKG